MDALTQTEINRINSSAVYSNFEIDVMTDVDSWILKQKNWFEIYGSYENAVKAFWKEKLDQ